MLRINKINSLVGKIDDFKSNNKAQALILVGELKNEINKVEEQIQTTHYDIQSILNQFGRKDMDE